MSLDVAGDSDLVRLPSAHDAVETAERSKRRSVRRESRCLPTSTVPRRQAELG
jgi:hypothetical protein